MTTPTSSEKFIVRFLSKFGAREWRVLLEAVNGDVELLDDLRFTEIEAIATRLGFMSASAYAGTLLSFKHAIEDIIKQVEG